jgi:hypothetical protein
MVEILMAFFFLVTAIFYELDAVRNSKFSSMNTNDQYSINISISS